MILPKDEESGHQVEVYIRDRADMKSGHRGGGSSILMGHTNG